MAMSAHKPIASQGTYSIPLRALLMFARYSRLIKNQVNCIINFMLVFVFAGSVSNTHKSNNEHKHSTQ